MRTHAKPQTEIITQTYYVGDILGVMPDLGPGSPSPEDSNQPATVARPKVDMQPVMNLISSTIAPGTWQMTAHLASAVARKTNRMVPFYLSISLIVRCPKDVHDQVANLLRGLRELLEARDARTVRPDPSQVSGPCMALLSRHPVPRKRHRRRGSASNNSWTNCKRRSKNFADHDESLDPHSAEQGYSSCAVQ